MELSLAHEQARRKEGDGTEDEGQGGMEGAGPSQDAAMMTRPPGRRPSQVLADIGRNPNDGMMAMPPGRRPSQVMVEITPTAAMEDGQDAKGSAAQGSLELQRSRGGASQGAAHGSNTPRKGEGKGRARGGEGRPEDIGSERFTSPNG